MPLCLKNEKLDQIVLDKFGYTDVPETELAEWNKFLQRYKFPKKEITIGLIGKYIELKDAYISIYESFIHAGAQNECKVNVERIHAEEINKNNLKEKLGNLDGIFVAPGFGQRGIDGKIYAIQYARENNIPFFGICLGMQMAVIEFARNVLKLEDANSAEMKQNCKNPVDRIGP